MTKDATARLSAIHGPAAGSHVDADVLDQMRDTVLGLLAGLDRPPRALRVRAHRVEIEVEWPDRDLAVTAADPPAAVPGGIAGAGAAGGAPAGAAGSATTGQYLTAHSVGVFYRSPEPGAKPFVEPGDVVTSGQQVGIIEAMKLMMPVEAEVAGRVVEVLVSDGQPVEYGDHLFAIEPAGS